MHRWNELDEWIASYCKPSDTPGFHQRLTRLLVGGDLSVDLPAQSHRSWVAMYSRRRKTRWSHHCVRRPRVAGDSRIRKADWFRQTVHKPLVVGPAASTLQRSDCG